MQVIGFNFDKIEVERKKQPQGKLEIKSNVIIKSITQEKVDMLKDKDVLKFDFHFFIEYHPEIATISFNGSVLSIIEKDKVKEIIKKWKNKKISDDVRLPLFNMILTKCNLKALQFEEEFALPTHVPMPRLSPQENNQSYVG